MIDIHIRISRRFIFWVAAILLVFFVLAWVMGSRGGSSGVSVQVSAAPSTPNLWLIQTGMTKNDVLRRFGSPMAVSTRGGLKIRETCWWYSAARLHTSADGRTFCFSRNRVVRILHGYDG